MVENTEGHTHSEECEQILFFMAKSSKCRKFYDMTDPSYRNFICDIVRTLEASYFKKGTIILREVEEVNEITFINEGTIGVGFEINK